MAKTNRYRLPPEAVASLINEQRVLHDLLEEMDRAEKCDIDCQDLREVHRQASERIQNLLDQYGPSAK